MVTNPQPQLPASPPGVSLPETIRELRASGLTVGDIARLFGVHPKAVGAVLTPNTDETVAESRLKVVRESGDGSHSGENKNGIRKGQ